MGWGEHPGKGDGEERGGKPVVESFLTFSFNKKRELLVGSCRGNLYIWDIRSGIKDDHMRYKYRTVIFPKCIITAVLAENDFLVAGDNDGNLVLLDTDGNKIYCLNSPQSTGDKVDIEAIPINQLGKAFRNKASKILRAGRWIIAAFENGRVEVYDIFTPDMAAPVDAYVNQDAVGGLGSTLRDLQVNEADGEVAMLYSGGKDTYTGKTQTRPAFVAWTPRLRNGEDALPKEVGGDADGFVEIINAAMARVKGKIGGITERKKVEIAAADLDDLDEKTFPPKIVPFYGFQKIMRNLDNVEKYLGKIAKSGNLSKYRKRLNECLSHHTRLVFLAKASAEFIYKNSKLRSSEMVPIKLCDVQSSVKVASPRYWEAAAAAAAVTTLGGGGGEGGNQLESDAQRIEREAKDSKKSSDPILAMLERLCRSLRVTHIELCKLVNVFDTVCSGGINNPELVKPLLDVYQLMLQMKEDVKETGKRAGETGNNLGSNWYENGGDYKEAIVPIISKK